MITATPVIILNHLRYADNSIIVHALAQDFGRISFLVYGVGQKNRAKLSAFQPLYLLQTQMYVKSTRGLQKLKEYALSPPLFNIASDIHKSSIALFIAELLSKTIREEYPDKQLFEFLTTSILILDELEENLSLFPLMFLLKFSRYLGFAPIAPIKGTKYFDFKEGKTTNIKPDHSFYIDNTQQRYFSELMMLNYGESHPLGTNPKLRREMLELMLKVYEIHILNLTSLKSYPVIQAVFAV